MKLERDRHRDGTAPSRAGISFPNPAKQFERLNNGSVIKGNKFVDAMNVNPLTSAKSSPISYGSPKSSPRGMDKFKET